MTFAQPTAGGDAPTDIASLRDRVMEMVFSAKLYSCPIGSQNSINAITAFVESEVSDALSAERARVIEAAIVAIKKARRTKIVGPESLTRAEHRLWDKTRYDTFKEAEAALRALGQQDTGGADHA
jgi:hypothetical protein